MGIAMDNRDVRWQRLVNAARQESTPAWELTGERLTEILRIAATSRTGMVDLPRWCVVTAWSALAAIALFAFCLTDFSPLATSGPVELAEVCPWGPVP